MWHAAKRLGLPEFNFFVISLSVQRETGGNLAETLDNLEQILRRRKQMRLKIRAMASEATWSALIIGSLPFIMGVLMFLVSPSYIRHLITDPMGRLMLRRGRVQPHGRQLRHAQDDEVRDMSLADAPFGPHGGLLLGLVVGLANFLTIFSVMRALSPKDLLPPAPGPTPGGAEELRSARPTPRRAAGPRPMGLARALIQRLKLDRSGEARQVADLLAQAGWRTKDAVTVFLTLRLVSPFVVGAAAYVFAPAFLHGAGALQRLLVAGAATLAGAYLPSLLLKNAIERRRQNIRKGLPDALDLMVICAEAGLSLDAAVTRVGREIGANAPELADEFGLTAIELGFLPDRREALLNLARRVGQSEVAGRGEHPGADREIRHAAGPGPACAGQRVPRDPDAARRGKGGPPAGDPDGADDHLHPAAAVRDPDRTGDPAGAGGQLALSRPRGRPSAERPRRARTASPAVRPRRRAWPRRRCSARRTP